MPMDQTILGDSFIVASISFLITQAEVFGGLRDWAKRRNPRFLGYLFSCFVCLSLWFSFLVVALLHSPLFSGPVFSVFWLSLTWQVVVIALVKYIDTEVLEIEDAPKTNQ